MIGARAASPAESGQHATLANRLRRVAVRGLWGTKSIGHIDLNRDPAHCVLLLGSARSGTTWLGEVLNRDHDYRVLFEPLRPGTVRRLAAFHDVRYLPGSATSGPHFEAMSALLCGRVRNPWVDHTSVKLLPRRRLLKEIRANCLAPWLSASFPQSPLVVVVRHPLEVVASRQRLGWQDHLDELLVDRLLVEDHLGAQFGMLNALRDPVVRSVAAWAIETIVPLRRMGPSGCLTFYESLRDGSELELLRVLRHAGQQPRLPLGNVLDKPSRTSRTKVVPGRRVTGPPGSGVFSPRQVDESRMVLAAFGLDRVYDVTEHVPDPVGAASLRAV